MGKTGFIDEQEYLLEEHSYDWYFTAYDIFQ